MNILECLNMKIKYVIIYIVIILSIIGSLVLYENSRYIKFDNI